MKRLAVILLIVVAVLASGCDALDDDVAATVGSKDITIAQVKKLMPTVATLPDVAPSAAAVGQDDGIEADRIDGPLARLALNYLIEGEVGRQELALHKGRIEQDDRDSAQQALTSNGVSAKAAKVIVEMTAPAYVLQRVMSAAGGSASAAVKREAQAIVDSIPPAQRKYVCINGLVGLTEGAAPVRQLIASGTDLGDSAAFASTGYSPLGDGTSATCLLMADTRIPTEITGALGDKAKGDSGDVDFQDPNGAATLFYDVVEVKPLTVTDSQVLQAAQSRATTPQSAIAASKVHVSVDPRFGTYNARAGVLGPVQPLVPAGPKPVAVSSPQP